MLIARERFPDWLASRAASSSARVALEAGGRSWTFTDLDAAVTALAHALAARGVADGDRIATLLPNGPLPVMLPHAALRLGAALVPLNVRLSDAELAWQLGDAAPRVLVADEETRARAEGIANSSIPVIALDAHGAMEDALLSERADLRPLRFVHPADAVLAVIYTSGTTGRPKGAMLTVGNFWWSAIGSALNLGAPADERWLACMPLFHVGGLSIVLRSAIFGGTAIVHPGFDAAAVNAAIDRDGITIVSVVAVMLQRMLDARDDQPFPPTLRCVLLGGGPAPGALVERCAAAGIPVVPTYGLTEACSQVATVAPEDAAREHGSVGRPLYPNEVRISASDGGDARAGEVGEILVRGPIVMAGYFGAPDATSRAIVDGWLHTGDLGMLDASGALHVLDRRDDLVVTGGENVYPAEVEAALLAHPAVAEAAVIGAPDEIWGQRVVAVVRLADGRTDRADELRAYLRGRLAGYKVPREIRFVTEPLPRTASGKLRRSALRED